MTEKRLAVQWGFPICSGMSFTHLSKVTANPYNISLLSANINHMLEDMHVTAAASTRLCLLFLVSFFDELTFDIKLTDDGTVRLWRFVGNAPISKAGKRCEYRRPEYPHAVVEVEITDEGDLCFFAELKIDPSDSEREICITHMIESYLSVITNMCLKTV